MKQLTREQAAIIGAFTGIGCGPFEDIHQLAELMLGRPVWTHEFADKEVWQELKDKVKPKFLELCAMKGEA